MSTLKVDNIRHNSATSDAITMASDGTCTAKLTSVGGGHLSNRNKIINGAMLVSQRATSKTDAGAGYNTVDRMRMSKNNLGTAEITHEQSTDSPNGFAKSVKNTVTTAEGSVGVDDAFRPLQYRFEGQDLQDLAYGTSDAKSLTLSFYVKSSVTGTYSLSFRNITAGTYRLRSTTYTIDSANTWEKKIITIAGDTSTAIVDDNASRFEIYWCGGSGTNFNSSNVAASGWADYVSGGLHYGHTVQLQNTLGSTFLLTGIQLEVGDTATLFEHRSYGEEFARCQRYYQQYVNISAVGYVPDNSSRSYSHAVPLPVAMRAGPTMSITNTGSSNGQMISDGDTNRYISSVLSQGSKTTHMSVSFNISGDLSDYRGAYLFGTENTTYQTTYKIEAEL